MLDFDKLDLLFDNADGEPPLHMALYDRRVLVPLTMVPSMQELAIERDVDEAAVHRMAEQGWFVVSVGNSADGGPGIPLFVISRIALFKQLERNGWSGRELRAFAEYEDTMVDEIYTTDELSYEDDDVLLLLNDLEESLRHNYTTLRMIDNPTTRTEEDASWSLNIPREQVEDQIAILKANQEYLARLAEAHAAPPMEVKKHAFKLRFRNEMIRVMLNAQERKKAEYGYSFFVQFSGLQNPMVGDFGDGVDWQATLTRPWSAEDGLPIRLPGVVLHGDQVTINGSPQPARYDDLWKQFDLETYFRIRAEIAYSRICLHCLKKLPDTAVQSKKYCGDRCRNTAKQRRHRESSPRKVQESQIKYWTSVGEMMKRS